MSIHPPKLEAKVAFIMGPKGFYMPMISMKVAAILLQFSQNRIGLDFLVSYYYQIEF